MRLAKNGADTCAEAYRHRHDKHRAARNSRREFNRHRVILNDSFTNNDFLFATTIATARHIRRRRTTRLSTYDASAVDASRYIRPAVKPTTRAITSLSSSLTLILYDASREQPVGDALPSLAPSFGFSSGHRSSLCCKMGIIYYVCFAV